MPRIIFFSFVACGVLALSFGTLLSQENDEPEEKVRAVVREAPGADEAPQSPMEERAVAQPPQKKASPEEVKVWYVPPEGWRVEDIAGSAHKVAVGPPVEGFVPNISISEVYFEGDLETFITQNLSDLKNQKEETSFLGRSNFVTKSGVKGVKLIVEMNRNGRKFKNNYYIFRPLQTKPIVLFNCVAPQETGAQMSPLFDLSMKTVQIKFLDPIPNRAKN